MTADLNPTLESQLAKLTQWPGDTPQLWRTSLASHTSGKNTAGTWGTRMAQFALRPGWLACAAVLVLFVSAAVVNLLPQSNHDLWDIVRQNRVTPQQFVCPSSGNESTSCGEDYLLYGKGMTPTDGAIRRGVATGRTLASPPPDASPNSDDFVPESSTRQIVRTATIELRVQDVRGVFMKIGMIPSEAKGEYVQDSAINGADEYLHGNIKLRVAASRLHEVLIKLREFGEVASEQVNGEDVTAQAVDLDARLRNERRIEEELLGLLTSREDAPLKDILDVRSKLGDVRREIERLTAQQSQLSHLVSLATVLVLLQPTDAPVLSHDSNWTYFKNACERSWQNGVAFLANTIATMIAIVIGGLFWWCILIVAAFAIIRRRRARHTSQAE